jgi:hypothetical protein
LAIRWQGRGSKRSADPGVTAVDKRGRPQTPFEDAVLTESAAASCGDAGRELSPDEGNGNTICFDDVRV